MSTDLFELSRASDLFKETQTAFAAYCREPSTQLLLFLLFSLNHLSEWITEASPDDLRKKRERKTALLPNEEFFFALDRLEEFHIIRELCNRSKHHRIKRGSSSTSITHGLTADGSCNDSLGQVCYRIDGVDSRKIFVPVFQAYYRWFSTHQTAGSSV